MMTSRTLLLLGFLILLSGCAQRCVYPDSISDAPPVQCFYHLVVTDINTENHTITARIPDALNYSDRPPDSFTFRIREFDELKTLLKKDQEYYFIREGNAAFLDVFYGTPKGIDRDSYKAGK
jgi:hypothetical protein